MEMDEGRKIKSEGGGAEGGRKNVREVKMRE